MTTNADNIVLETRHIKKHYGVTKANDDVSVRLVRGEIRSLIGENGSEKSTLISIIAGISQRDSGEMILLGKPFAPKSPLDSAFAGIGTVVQELWLVDDCPWG